MSEMLERVARSLCSGDPEVLMYTVTRESGEIITSFSDLGPDSKAFPVWHNHIRSAKAVLLALRNPTEEMAKRGGHAREFQLPDGFYEDDLIDQHDAEAAIAAFQAMIDEALRDPTDKTQE